MKSIKFTGNFRDLKPDGWTFQKLFARNYRCYWKSIDPNNPHDDKVWIWQANGGNIEYEDFYSYSYLIFEIILNGDYIKGECNLGGDIYYRWVISRIHYTITPFVSEQHEDWYVRKYLAARKIPDEEIDNQIKALHSENKRIIFDKDLVSFVLNMNNKGWLKIE
jgi:hypothetical protein